MSIVFEVILITIGVFSLAILTIAAYSCYDARKFRYVTKGPSKDVKRNATECVGRYE